MLLGDSRAARRQWRAETRRKFPHLVDLVPPEDGFDPAVEQAIVRFLEPLRGKFNVYSETEGGEVFVRYCFAFASDAEAFFARFRHGHERRTFKMAH